MKNLILSCFFLLSLPVVANATQQKSTSFFNLDQQDLHWFKWVEGEREISLQWTHASVDDVNKYAPRLLTAKIDNTFLNKSLFFVNFHQSLLYFPYVLKWGVRGSAGITRNYSVENTYFFPIELSIISHLQVFKHQAIIPFVELGVSSWVVDMQDFSTAFPFWSAGVSVSLSLFKSSLRYTLPNDYGVQDLGMIFEFSRLINHKQEFKSFMQTFQAGIYFKF